MSDERYDEETSTNWVFRDYSADELVPDDEVNGWIRALKAGQTPDGRDLESVNYVFSDAEAAEYNEPALSFARIGTYVGTLDEPEPFDPEEDVSFTTKEDFGI